MCGIAGFVDLPLTTEYAANLLDRMCKVIRHRGPDDQGTWVEDGIGLGMRRLAIIDLSGGHQPIFNEDRSILVVFNGEIYNYQSIRQKLVALGHHFETNSDTEVIVHAYETYGDECVKQLQGMFVFALWDKKRQRLLAARDRFGKKPFNYYWDGQRFIFGSEIKSILEAHIPREINYEALDDFLLYRYVPTPETLFKNVMKLPAAHILTYENGQVQTERYWDVTFSPTNPDNEVTALARIRELLENAVRVRLMSEVPLGAFLSGGVDSSVVVGLMSKMMSQPVKTFSIGFEEDEYSELPYARRIAQHFHTDHHEFIVKSDLVSVLPQLIWAFDEPFGDSSMLPTYYVSKLAREHVTVVLTGDGGDEIFGGYQQYRREYLIHRIPALLRTQLGQASRFIPEGMKGKERLATWLKDYGTRSIEAIMLFPDYPRKQLYTPEFYERVCEHDPFSLQYSAYRSVRRLDITAAMQYVDTHMYLTDDILVKVDKASMLNSIETRAPLLDQYLAEYVTSLRPSVRMHQGMQKYLLKKIAAELLPPGILNRRKQGFSIPLTQWFRNDVSSYAHDILGSTRARQRGLFQPQFLEKLLQTDGSSRLQNHSQALWTLLCLELWFQTYMDDAAQQPDEPSSLLSAHLPGLR